MPLVPFTVPSSLDESSGSSGTTVPFTVPGSLGAVALTASNADSIGISDSTSFTLQNVKFFSGTDSIGIFDSISFILQNVDNVFIFDPVGIKDSLSKTRTYTKTDLVGLTDSLAKDRTYGKTDLVGVHDFFSIVPGVGTSPTDQVGITDSFVMTTKKPIFVDRIGITDSASFAYLPAVQLSTPYSLTGITDRMRYTVIEVNTNRILSRDLNALEPEVLVNLSAPSHMAFKLMPSEQQGSAYGIDWKNWGQIIVCEIEVGYVRQILAVGIVTDNKVDPASGVLQIETTGYSSYPKGIPFLDNYNPIAIDPFEIVQRMWAHVQGFSNANLGVEVYPALSNTQMLPGYSFDGSILSFDFFAVFYRSVDLQDCGDIIMGLARDIPFDYFEEAEWNTDRTELTKNVRLAYPYGGIRQEYLSFRLGENVISGELAEETDIQPVSDVVIRGWLPGRMMSAQLSNADQTRLRRTAVEEDAKIDSTERAAAWAKRKLQRRNVPTYFSKIMVEPNHSNAPFGSYSVGDSIYVEAQEYPWVGDIGEWHRITSIGYAEGKGLVELGLKVEGAFNYDPIDYNPNFEQEPTQDYNRLYNGYFAKNLGGWKAQGGSWIRLTGFTYETALSPNAGSVRVDCDDHGETFKSSRAHVTSGMHVKLQCVVRWANITSTLDGAFQLKAFTSLDSVPVSSFVVDEYIHPQGAHGWQRLENLNWVVPSNVNEIALQFVVNAGVTGGQSFWTYARVVDIEDEP